MTGFRKALLFIGLVGLLGLLMPAPAMAQGWAIQGQAVDSTGRPLPFATVRVCPYTASGAPCSPLTSLWSDIPQTHAISNPYTTDQLGNFTFVVAAQQSYIVQIYSAGKIAASYLYTAGLPSGSGTFTALTVDATSTATGGATEVVGILNHPLPSLTPGCINWSGTAWTFSCGSSLPTGVWQRNDTVITGDSTTEYVAQEPIILYEPGTATPFNMWYTCGWATDPTPGMCYQTGIDGRNFTKQNGGSPVISDVFHGFILEVSGTYIWYGVPIVGGVVATAFTREHSADGITWVTDSTNILPAIGGWDTGGKGNIWVGVLSGNHWWALYEAAGTDGIFRVGEADSYDAGLTWTPAASNPRIYSGPTLAGSGGCGGPDVHGPYSGIYYARVHCAPVGVDLPTDIYRWQSTDRVNWTENPVTPVLSRRTVDEGPGISNVGQVADWMSVEVNGSTYGYYSAGDTQSPSATDHGLHIKLVVAPMTEAELYTTSEGDGGSLGFPYSAQNLPLYGYGGPQWSTDGEQTPIDPWTAGRFDIGARSIGQVGNDLSDSYNAYWNPGFGNYAVINGYGWVNSFDTSTGIYHEGGSSTSVAAGSAQTVRDLRTLDKNGNEVLLGGATLGGPLSAPYGSIVGPSLSFYYPASPAQSCIAVGWFSSPTYDGTSNVTFAAAAGLNTGSITCVTANYGLVTQIYPSTGSSPQVINMATQFRNSGGYWTQLGSAGFTVPGINLSGSTSPLEFGGSAGTSGQCPISGGAGVTPSWGSCGSGGGGDTITSPNSTLTVGGSSTSTTLDLEGAAGKIMAGATPALTYTPALGVDGSNAGSLQTANGSASAHTIWGSAATTSNTILGPATAPTTGDLLQCTTSGTTCTMTDSMVNATSSGTPGVCIATSCVNWPTSGTVTFPNGTYNVQQSLSLLAGTYVNGDLCSYASSGTLLNCNTAAGTGTVTDGSGSTTANQLALATSTAHVLGYATTLPTAAEPAHTGDVTNSAGSLALTIAANAVTGAKMANATVTATQLAAQYSKGSCTEAWGGSGTSHALTSGDDAVVNNTCYNDSGVTRTITAVKCRNDNASNTTTVNPTFGSAGTGTTILSGALTCGNSYAYSSSGTVSNASWTTGSGIDPVQGGTLTGTSVALLVEYTF